MFSSSLERLVDTARALPGEILPAPKVQLPLGAEPPADLHAATRDLGALRERLGRLLDKLARRLEPSLKTALQHADVAWDAFDEVAVLDAELEGEAAELGAAAAALEREEDPERHAVGTEIRMVLESTLGLVHLIERRLATLVRLRVQSGDRALLPGGRPFLDIASALAEASLGWR